MLARVGLIQQEEINIMNSIPRKNNKGYMFACITKLRKYIFLAMLSRCLLIKIVYIRRFYC